MAKEKDFLWFTSSLAYITHCVPRSQLLKKPRYLEFIFPAYREPRSQLHKIHRHLDFIYICAYRVPRSQPFSLTHSMRRGIWVFWSYSLFSPKSVGKNSDSTRGRVKRALKANDGWVCYFNFTPAVLRGKDLFPYIFQSALGCEVPGNNRNMLYDSKPTRIK